MSSEDHEQQESQEPKDYRDQSRLCPTCRNEISILATRCFHCGEQVGRPKKEQAQLTIEDLGGERKSTYTVSGNVMDALEAFREEELVEEDAGSHKLGEDLPELDSLNKALADVDGDGGIKKKKNKYGPTPKELAIRYIMITLVTFCLVVGCFYGYKYGMAAYELRKNPPAPIYNNQAANWLAAGRPLPEVLEEAMAALNQNDTEENHAIANQVRERFRTEIDGLLNADPWKASYLGEASSLASHIIRLENNTEMIRLAQVVNEEVMAYKFVLKSIDPANNQAVYSHDGQEYTIKVGERLLDRFELRKVNNSAFLTDTKRQKKNGTHRNFQQVPNGPLRPL